MRYTMPLLLSAFLPAACGSGPAVPLPDGVSVAVAGFETYVNDHNGFARVRRGYQQPGDAAVLAAFEDADPDDPAGYRNLIALDEALYGGRMIVEVIAEVDTGGDTAQRLLRLTVDQSPFVNERGGQPIAEGGQFFLRGANYSWVSIDDGPLISGSDPRGLVNMVLDFDTETASLSLRTGVEGSSAIRSEVTATALPFNIRTGAFGGGVTIVVWDNDSPDILSVDGVLRGSLGGTPDYDSGQHNLSASGLYFGEGADVATGRLLRLDGLFVGRDPNALP